MLTEIIAKGLMLAGTGFAVAISSQSPTKRYSTPLWTSDGEFVSLESARVLTDGRIVIVDRSQREVWLLAADGEPIRQIGRQGSGPHEYRMPHAALPLPGDSTVIIDRGLRRVLLVDQRGVPVRTVALPLGMQGWESFSRSDLRGRVVFPTTAAPRAPSTQVVLVGWDWRTGDVDTLSSLLVPAPKVIQTERNVMMTRVVPYLPQDGWTSLPGGGFVVVRADYRTEWLDANGAMRRRGPSIAFDPVKVTKSERESVSELVRSAVPDRKPAFDPNYIVASDDGQVWIRRYVDDSSATFDWDIVDAAGRHVGTAKFDKGRIVLAVTRTRVFVSYSDDDGFRRLQAFAR